MDQKQLDERTQHFRAAASREAGVHAYKGLEIHAKPGLHEHVAQILQRYVPGGSTVLDMAAGSGALALRLQDSGYRVQATDYVAEGFRLQGQIPFKALDLNGDFADTFSEPLDCISACEIIEHLENPRHFMRQCRKLLKPDGTLLLTTPNPNSPPSKALFIRSGHAGWFSDEDYHHYGHIAPLTIKILRECARESGFKIKHLGSYGDPWEHVHGQPKLKLLAKIIAAIDPAPPEQKGDVLVAILGA